MKRIVKAAAPRAEEFTFRGERPMRLDQAIAAARPALSRSLARRLIGDGAVFLDGRRCRIASRLLRGGERVRVVVAPVDDPGALRVLYEDDDVIAIDKPPGMPAVPTRSAAAGTAMETLRRQLVEARAKSALWVVHRLDAGTSGVLVLARNVTAARVLSRAFHEQRVLKRYVALVVGVPEGDAGTIDACLEARNGRARLSEQGKPASTSWRVLERRTRTALVELEPRTGRMHQLRVHLASIGHPVAGDHLYGGAPAPRLMLHAATLRLPHPRSGEPIEVQSPLPRELTLDPSIP